MTDTSVTTPPALLDFVIQTADDHLILGHRLSEWCGHAPTLEEDLSMPNMALDLIGQASALYSYAAQLEGRGRSEDDIAYLRSDREYRNCLLVERPNVDFAHSMLRQLYFSAAMQLFWSANVDSPDTTLAGIAGKAVKETSYHVRHCSEWVIRLGDGTAESARRMQSAVDALHPYTDELFAVGTATQSCIEHGIIADPGPLQSAWQSTIQSVFAQANLQTPDVPWPQSGGRDGLHTEDFGYLLTELQYMQRAYPGAQW